jgi:carboxymethylenebutenolidase
MQTTFLSAGCAIRLDVSVPAAPGPHPAILILHGSGGNSGYWLDRIAPFTGGLNLALFAVHYFDATGTSRAEPAQLNDGVHVPAWLQTVRDAIAHLRTLPGVDSKRIALVGISLGGFLALALGTEPEQKIRTIVSISGGLAPPWDTLADAAFPPTLILHGDRDTVVPVSQAHAVDAILTRLGVRHELRILPGEGHFFSAGAQLQLLGEFARFLGANL